MTENSEKLRSQPPFSLSNCAAHQIVSQGRQFQEVECSMRSPFQRDRDRIIHSMAFRRLTHKTQVFIYHEGDHFRTRLTHTLEVAQIARSIARILGLDEDLTEAVALAHDLGHSPFGHAGERALNRLMQDVGGFDHNAQSLKQVTLLEHKYPNFDGLNLSYECLESIVKHNGPLVDKESGEINLPPYIAAFNEALDLKLDSYALLEAQVAALADDIAYCNHDIDDGLRGGLISIKDLEAVPLTRKILEDIGAKYGKLEEGRLLNELNRRLITQMIQDIIEEAERRYELLRPERGEDVRLCGQPIIEFSDQMREEVVILRRFLFEHVYRDEWINKVMGRAEKIVEDLFMAYQETHSLMPEHWQNIIQNDDDAQRLIHICDFVAGMTDRYAMQEHRRLFDATPELR